MTETVTVRATDGSSFLEETQYVSLVFGATVAIAGYWIGQLIARWLAIWPIGRFIKRF